MDATVQNIADIINGLTAFDVDYTNNSARHLILASPGMQDVTVIVDTKPLTEYKLKVYREDSIQFKKVQDNFVNVSDDASSFFRAAQMYYLIHYIDLLKLVHLVDDSQPQTLKELAKIINDKDYLSHKLQCLKNGKVKLNYIEEDLKYQTLNWVSTYRSGNTMLDLDIYVTSIKMKLNDFLCLSNNHFDDIELNLSTIQLFEIFCFLFDFKFLDN